MSAAMVRWCHRQDVRLLFIGLSGNMIAKRNLLMLSDLPWSLPWQLPSGGTICYESEHASSWDAI
jgi:hypothetical protein